MIRATLRCVTLAFSMSASVPDGFAATYYVATTGNDTAAGTLAAPWRTIQKAASTAVAGDTVYIRVGTYRETVTFANSGTAAAPITFQNYPNEAPTLTGFDVVTPGSGGVGQWTQHSGDIWKIQLTSALGFGAGSTGRNQAALDGTLLQEARWPNSSVYADVNRTNLALSDAGSVDTGSRDGQGLYTCTYTDAALSGFAASAWAGATMRMAVGKQWNPAGGSVTASTSSTITFKYRYVGGGNDTPSRDDPYFLFGRLVALDAAGEFFLDDSGRDGAAFVLYAIKPGGGSPAASVLEVRTRDLGLDLSGRSYVNVSGLRLLAARVTTSSTTANCTLDRLTLEQAGYNLNLLLSASGDSVTLAGTSNALKNSTVEGASEFGVKFDSAANGGIVDNCVVRRCGFSGINTGDSRAPLVQRNTVFDTGSFCIVYNSKAGRFLENHVYYAGTHCVDIGLINAFAIGDAEGTEIARNWAHDNLAPFDLTAHSWNGGCGIRADCGFAPLASLNVLIHHNVVWNTTHPGSIVFWGVTDGQWAATSRTYATGSASIDTREFAYNNTLASNIEYGAGRTGGVPIYASGGRVKNNLLSGTFKPNGVTTANVEADTNLLASAATGFAANTVAATTFVSPLDSAFAIPAAAIDAGAVIAPYTDGAIGAKPDLGAYESGGAFWIPGATALAEHVATLTASYSASTGRVTLSGFPAGRVVPTTAKIAIGAATSSAVRPTLDLATHAMTAEFTITLTGVGGTQTVSLALDGTTFTALTAPVTLPGAQTGTAPAITAHPVAVTVAAGGSATFTVAASGDAPLTYQWRKDGATIAGATAATLSLTAVAAANAGAYSCVVTNTFGSATSNAATLAVTTVEPGRLINLSVLTSLTSAGETFSLGYVVSGATTTNAKPLVIRAAGPSLAALGVAGTLADPKLELFAGATAAGGNEDWGGAAALSASMAAVGAFAYSSPTSRDAALAATITGRDNSVKISAGASAPTGTGVVLAEVYDATPAASFDATTTPRLINFSVLKNVGTSLTLGFVIGGATSKTVLARAIGPTLGATPFNVAGAMADPKIELFDATGKSVAANDNWAGTSALTTAFGQTGAFSLTASSKDAALVAVLTPCNYSVQVTVASGATGLALVEVYDVP